MLVFVGLNKQLTISSVPTKVGSMLHHLVVNLVEISGSQTYKEQSKSIAESGLSGKEYMLMFNHLAYLH